MGWVGLNSFALSAGSNVSSTTVLLLLFRRFTTPCRILAVLPALRSACTVLYCTVPKLHCTALHYQSTRFRFCLVSLRRFLKSLLRALAALEIPLRCLRILGLGQACSTMARSLLTASVLFRPCVRCSCEARLRIPSLERRWDCCCRNRSWTSAGIQDWRWVRSRRSSTLVLTLLTFCPPDPEDLTKENSSLSSGMRTCFGTVQVPPPLLERLLLLLLLLLLFRGCLVWGFFLGSYGTYVHVGTISLLPLA
mmetsp:Transcript_1521/g.3968  ORF Transcript_1521/g.3968 Transcript_1521/m.3968 type:complete len:251 (+) Transcript_1521:550-1302(+)